MSESPILLLLPDGLSGEVHWIYDVIGIALVGLFGTLSAGWFTLARTQGWATFARWFVDLRLT